MTRRETVHSEFTQAEKRNTLENDQRVHKNTYFLTLTPTKAAVSQRPASRRAIWSARRQRRDTPLARIGLLTLLGKSRLSACGLMK